jgi:hypothetical protein
MTMDYDYFVVNWGRAFLLIALTNNPSKWSFMAWLETHPDIPPSLIFFAGAVLVLGYVWFFKQAMKHLKGIGILVLAILMFCLILGLAQLAYRIPFMRELEVGWILIVFISAFAAIGVSYRGG